MTDKTKETEKDKPVSEEEILACDCGRLLLLEDEMRKIGNPIIIGKDAP